MSKSYLSECFHMKDFRVFRIFMGVQVGRNLEGFFYKIFMSKYVLDILSKVKLLGANPASILVEQRQLALADG